MEYREFGQESQNLVEELKERESELRDSVDGLGLQRDRMEKRLTELEAEEKAGLLKMPSAIGRVGEREVRDPDVVRDEGKKRDDTQGREDVRGPEKRETRNGRGSESSRSHARKS